MNTCTVQLYIQKPRIYEDKNLGMVSTCFQLMSKTNRKCTVVEYAIPVRDTRAHYLSFSDGPIVAVPGRNEAQNVVGECH